MYAIYFQEFSAQGYFTLFIFNIDGQGGWF